MLRRVPLFSVRVAALLASYALLCPPLLAQAQVPGAPVGVSAVVSGPIVTLSWSPPNSGGAPTTYLIDAGTSSGASNVASGLSVGNTLGVVSPPLAAGTYFVRVSAANQFGPGPVSTEVSFTIQGLTTPGAPIGLTGSVSGTLVTHRVASESFRRAGYGLPRGRGHGPWREQRRQRAGRGQPPVGVRQSGTGGLLHPRPRAERGRHQPALERSVRDGRCCRAAGRSDRPRLHGCRRKRQPVLERARHRRRADRLPHRSRQLPPGSPTSSCTTSARSPASAQWHRPVSSSCACARSTRRVQAARQTRSSSWRRRPSAPGSSPPR